MGWIFQREPLPRGTKAEDFIAAEYEFTNSKGERQEVAARARVGSVVYLALRVVPPASEPERKPFVTAVVVLTKRSAGGFGWKSMDESMGPYESNAPRSILDLLSPVQEVTQGVCVAWATAWRERCEANLQAKAAA